MDKNKKSEISLLVLLLWASAALACAYFIKSEWAVPVVFVVMAYQFGLLPEKLFSLIKTGKADVDVSSTKEGSAQSDGKEITEGKQARQPHILGNESQIEEKTRERIRQILPGFKFEREKELGTAGKISIRPDGFFQKNGVHFLLEIKHNAPNSSHIRFFDRYINFYQGTKRMAFFYLAFAFDGNRDTPQTKENRVKFEKEFDEHYRNYNAFLIWIDTNIDSERSKFSNSCNKQSY